MVTSEQSPARLKQAREAGVSAICDKPFNPNGVRAILEQILSESAA